MIARWKKVCFTHTHTHNNNYNTNDGTPIKFPLDYLRKENYYSITIKKQIRSATQNVDKHFAAYFVAVLK